MSEPHTIPRHSCFLVEDIEKSIGAYSSLSGGAEFGPIREMPMRWVGEGQDFTHVVRLCYSVDGTIELVGPLEKGIFGPSVPHGIHHIGHMAAVDLDEAIEQELSRGESLEWTVYLGDLKLAAFFAPTAHRPVRVELVSPAVLSMGPPP